MTATNYGVKNIRNRSPYGKANCELVFLTLDHLHPLNTRTSNVKSLGIELLTPKILPLKLDVSISLIFFIIFFIYIYCNGPLAKIIVALSALLFLICFETHITFDLIVPCYL